MGEKLTLRQRAEQALKHPNMIRMLNTLSSAEGTEKHGYYTNFGGSRLKDLSWHPNKVLGRTKDGVTTATGRYQFLGSTFNDQAKKQGLTDFGERSQDLAAVGLIIENGALEDVLKGDVTKAVYKLRHIWASLPDNPSKNQPHKTHAQIIEAWNRNGGNIDGSSFVHPSSDLYQMNGQQYDYRTTQPNTHTALQAPNPQNVFADFNQSMEKTIKPMQPEALTPWNDADFEIEPQPQKSDYQAQLAEAFGVSPQGASNGLGDYVSDLVRSIYDQA